MLFRSAIERIEISVKTQLIYALAYGTGAFGYTEQINLPNLSIEEHLRLIEDITKEIEHSREVFVAHFWEKYGDSHKYLPLWMAGEIMPFGCMLTMYRGSSDVIRKDIARYYGIQDEVLYSWLRTINVIRNICAHHSRLWNRVLGVKPFIPRINKHPQWHVPVQIPQDRIFSILTIFKYLLKIIAPQSKWDTRLMALLDEYPDISQRSMGFPDNWKESLLWK